MLQRDEIIEMSRQADIDHHRLWNDDGTNRLEAFAKLVAEKERDACAKVCEGLNLYGGSESRQLQRATLKDCAYAIRARGQE